MGPAFGRPGGPTGRSPEASNKNNLRSGVGGRGDEVTFFRREKTGKDTSA